MSEGWWECRVCGYAEFEDADSAAVCPYCYAAGLPAALSVTKPSTVSSLNRWALMRPRMAEEEKEPLAQYRGEPIWSESELASCFRQIHSTEQLLRILNEIDTGTGERGNPLFKKRKVLTDSPAPHNHPWINAISSILKEDGLELPRQKGRVKGWVFRAWLRLMDRWRCWRQRDDAYWERQMQREMREVDDDWDVCLHCGAEFAAKCPEVCPECGREDEESDTSP